MTDGSSEFETRVVASFARQKVMETLGVSIARVAPGEVEFTMPFADAFTQQHGFLHAGIVTTALDRACGQAGARVRGLRQQGRGLISGGH